MKSMLRNLLTFLFVLCVSSVASFGQLNPGQDVKWPSSCTAGLVYSPFSNTCVSVTGGGGSWGSITGTLSAQTDLQTALNAKASAPGNTLIETGNYTVTTSGQLIVMNCPSACTLTLPASIIPSFNVGVQTIGAGALTINPNGVTYTGITTGLLQGFSILITTDGTGYHSTDTITTFTGCTYTFSLPGSTLACSGGGGMADPGGNGFVYRTALNTTSVGTLTQLIAAYWSDSSCSTHSHLKKDGTCDDPTGTGSVTSGSTGQLAYYPSSGTTVGPLGVGAGLSVVGGNLVSTTSTDVLSSSKVAGTFASTKNEGASVAAGATITLVNYTGSDGYVATIFIAIGMTGAYTTAGVLGSTINVYYNGSSTPSISVPVQYFFGAVGIASNQAYTSRYISGINGTTIGAGPSFVSHIPIPFNGGIKIDLVNGDTTNGISIWSEVNYTTGITDSWPNTQQLLVKYLPLQACALNQDMQLAASTGTKGRILGLDWYMSGSSQTTQEGNFNYYLNGIEPAALQTSGSEDYFETGYNWSHLTAPFSNITGLSGVLFSSGGTLPSANLNAYRFHIDDPLTFTNGFNVHWQCGDSSEGSTAGATVGTVLWYYKEVAPSTTAATGYAKHVVISTTSGHFPSSTLTNYPMFVAFNTTLGNGAVAPTLTNLKSIANSGEVNDGMKDIMFDDCSGTQLPHEVLTWSATTGAFTAYVKVPSVSSSVATSVCMHWGNASATNSQDVQGLWNGYGAVHHMVTLYDSSGSGNTLTADNAPTAGTGMFGGGYTFNGSNQDLTQATPSNFTTTGPKSISVWFKFSSLTSCAAIFGFGSGSNRGETGYCNSGPLLFTNGGTAIQNSATYTGVTGSWHKFTYVLPSNVTNTAVIYVDGAPLTTTGGTGTPTAISTAPFYYAFQSGTTDRFPGSLAEGEIANFAFSAAQIATQYLNESAPATFLSVGSVQTP